MESGKHVGEQNKKRAHNGRIVAENHNRNPPQLIATKTQPTNAYYINQTQCILGQDKHPNDTSTGCLYYVWPKGVYMPPCVNRTVPSIYRVHRTNAHLSYWRGKSCREAALTAAASRLRPRIAYYHIGGSGDGDGGGLERRQGHGRYRKQGTSLPLSHPPSRVTTPTRIVSSVRKLRLRRERFRFFLFNEGRLSESSPLSIWSEIRSQIRNKCKMWTQKVPASCSVSSSTDTRCPHL